MLAPFQTRLLRPATLTTLCTAGCSRSRSERRSLRWRSPGQCGGGQCGLRCCRRAAGEGGAGGERGRRGDDCRRQGGRWDPATSCGYNAGVVCAGTQDDEAPWRLAGNSCDRRERTATWWRQAARLVVAIGQRRRVGHSVGGGRLIVECAVADDTADADASYPVVDANESESRQPATCTLIVERPNVVRTERRLRAESLGEQTGVAVGLRFCTCGAAPRHGRRREDGELIASFSHLPQRRPAGIRDPELEPSLSDGLPGIMRRPYRKAGCAGTSEGGGFCCLYSDVR